MTTDYSRTWIALEGGPLLSGDALHSPPNEMTESQVVTAWAMLDFIICKAEERKKQLRAVLLKFAEERGEVTRNGGNEVKVEGTKVIRDRRVSSCPDEVKLRNLLDSKHIRHDACFEPKTVEVLNMQKLEEMVARGLLTQEEMAPFFNVQYALRVKLNTALSDFLEGVFQRGNRSLHDLFGTDRE
jgi:hypothetical protein